VALKKFSNPETTIDGQARAHINFDGLKTLWVNTGTICNIECVGCYIESSPTNDAFIYFKHSDLKPFLQQAVDMHAQEIGFTGGEPFMNPDMLSMLEEALSLGFDVLVLSNAMRPMMRPKIQEELQKLRAQFPKSLKIRVSLDHYTAELHDKERGKGSFDIALIGIKWLIEKKFTISIAGRNPPDETDDDVRKGYKELFDLIGLKIDETADENLILFPEISGDPSPPEITSNCFDILDKDPSTVMCANSRMLVHKKGEKSPSVLACTIIPFDQRFDLGPTLSEATKPVSLNHPHCANFCILGGSSCS